MSVRTTLRHLNAAITGVLANVEDRYQARVIWLAGVVVLTWLDERRRPAPQRAVQ